VGFKGIRGGLGEMIRRWRCAKLRKEGESTLRRLKANVEEGGSWRKVGSVGDQKGGENFEGEHGSCCVRGLGKGKVWV